MAKTTKPETKVKATRLPITQLIVESAYGKTFSTGKAGFFGKVIDPSTGHRYQITGAVQLN
jgi:hypothetical protein